MKMAAGSLQSSTVLHARACSLCKLPVYTRGTGGYGTLTLLKQLAIPALKALKCIKDTGQTSTGFRTRRVWPPSVWQPRCWTVQSTAGNLTPTTLLVFIFLYFIFFPTVMEDWAPFFPTVTWHQHLHTQMAVTPLPLVSSERTNGKTSLLNLPGHYQGHWWWVRWDLLSMRDWGGTSSMKQGLPIWPLWGAFTPFFKTLVPVLSFNTIRATMVVFILWSMRFNTPIIPLTKPFV